MPWNSNYKISQLKPVHMYCRLSFLLMEHLFPFTVRSNEHNGLQTQINSQWQGHILYICNAHMLDFYWLYISMDNANSGLTEAINRLLQKNFLQKKKYDGQCLHS